MADETVIDAVNAALGGDHAANAGTDTVNDEDSAAPETDESSVDASTSDGAEDEGGEGRVGEDNTEDAGDADSASADSKPRERDPATGKFKKHGAEGDADKPGKKEPPKEPDAVNDPIPKDLKPETRERMTKLVAAAKEATAQRDEATKNFNTIVGGLHSASVTPEQYGEILNFMQAFNSGDPTQQEKALEALEAVADRLATLLGKERTVTDPLRAHEDLIKAVSEGHITVGYAREIARTRAKTTMQTELGTAHSQQMQQTQQAAAEREGARTALNDMETQLRRTDPQYEQKRAMLMPILRPIFQQIPVAQWAAQFQEAYNALRIAPEPRKAAVPANQPLRGGRSPAGGQVKQPTSALEAVSAALANMK